MPLSKKMISVSLMGVLLGASAPVYAKKVKKPVARQTRVKVSKLYSYHMSQLLKEKVGSEAYEKHFRRINELPGVQVRRGAICNRKKRRCRLMYITRRKPYAVGMTYSNTGTGPLGKNLIGIAAHKNDVFTGNDQFGVVTSTGLRSMWNDSYLWGLNYRAVVAKNGASIAAGFVKQFVTIPRSLAPTAGGSTAVPRSTVRTTHVTGTLPVYDTRDWSVQTSLRLNYVQIRGGVLIPETPIFINGDSDTPAAMVSLGVAHRSSIGMSRGNLTVVRVMSMPFMSTSNPTTTPVDLHAVLVKGSLSLTSAVGRGFLLQGRAFFQYNPRDKRVPAAYKTTFDDGGYAGQAVVGDSGGGVTGRVIYMLSRHATGNARRLLQRYGVNVYVGGGYARLKNVARPALLFPYRTARVLEAAGGVRFIIPQWHVLGLVGVAKAFRAPRSVTGTRFVVKFGATI